MRDEDHGEIELVSQFEKKVQDLGLDGDVESRDGFIGDDEFGFGGEGAGDGNALALATGEFVGIFPHVTRVEADSLHELTDSFGLLFFWKSWVSAGDGFREHGEDGHARVEGGVGVLEHHLEIETVLADGGAGKAGEGEIFEDYVSVGGLLKLHDGAREGGFSAA